MPTSAGKTRVAELAIAHTLITVPGSKCVYIAPYRALVGELEETFVNIFGDMGFKVSTIVDDAYTVDPFEQILIEESDLLVMTPEKLDLLQRTKPEYLESVLLFILDEGHIVNERDRGVKFELLLSRFKRRIPQARFIFLSAVVPDETLKDFAAWFNAGENGIIKTSWRPSLSRTAYFEWRGRGSGRLNYVRNVDKINEYVNGIIKQTEFTFEGKRGRKKRAIFPDGNSKSQTAAELAWKFAELGSVLVFCPQANFVTSVGDAIVTRLEYSTLSREDIPEYLNPSDNLSVPAAIEWLGPEHKVTRLLSRGIGIHFGALPDVVRKAVETDFRKRRFRIMIATNTLAQGVNLPIRTVIVHSCWRYVNGERVRISARDYWNIAGRAGRAGEETEGSIIHITHNGGDLRDFEYYLDRRDNVEGVKSALYQILLELLERRITDEELFQYLDPEILALLAEEGPEFFSESNIHNIFNESLVHVQAQHLKNGTKPLQKAFQIVASNIATTMDSKLWKLYSSTGLSSSSCEKLKEFTLANEEAMRRILTSFVSHDELISMLAEECLKLPEIQPEKEITINFREILRMWIGGASIKEMLSYFQENNLETEDFSAFIEDVFSYKLPWGVSGFIQIASNILSIDTGELSEFAKFFPSMIKYGVPTPSASWAISCGIPFREVAIRIADNHIRKKDTGQHTSFVEYLGQLSAENLDSEFNLRSPFLEEVARSLSKFVPNQYLRPYEVNLYPVKTWVAGIRHVSGSTLASRIKVGDNVELERDYDNLIDRNATFVIFKGERLGYVERALAQRIAVELDCGVTFSGMVTTVEDREIPNIEIKIETHGGLKQ
jgi:replicative superfamily II helicase